MNYVNHINKFASSQDVQSALNNEELVKPYVALVNGAVDYNTLSPSAPVSYLGEWSYDGSSTYTFQLNDTDPDKWGNPVKIAELTNVYSDGNLCDMDVKLNYDALNEYWHMEFFSPEESNVPSHDFTDVFGWDTGVMTDPNESSASINVGWYGDDNFIFSVEPGFMTTINPVDE